MSLCCGKNVQTAYCPDCGQANKSPLVAILAYIRKRLRDCTVQLEKRQQRWADHPVKDGDHLRRRAAMANRANTAISQWREWQEAIIAIMNKEE